ncbi:MAG: SPFH domain-containing protein [Cytophagales bacterium]|nr:SPFH domain-containing protein [Cytophagales bacterium]MDW8384934.1 SPFH domain-containing protein [Flammeovirgaceae bacterium]
MGWFRSQFIDIIEWLDDSSDTIVWRFEHYNNEIKNGAKLTVRQGQVAVFVNEGQIADVFQPGMYTLNTANLPILSSLKGWKYGFNSPFKAEVYFVNTKNFTDQKWGTKNPIMMRDPELGAIRLRAFGTYAFKVIEPETLMKEIVSTDAHFTVEEISNQLRNIIITRFADVVASERIPLLDLATHYDNISESLRRIVSPEFNQYGLEITKLLVENISLPQEVEAILDKKTSMNLMQGNLQQFTQFQAANSIEQAAQNPSGFAGMGMGFAVGQMMANQITGQFSTPQGAPTPPPIPPTVQFFVALHGQQSGPYSLEVLSNMAKQGTINGQTLVWKQGMSNWTPAHQVPDLTPIFASVPPPLPHQ